MKMRQANPSGLIILCETLTTGGAETFVLRLAAAMQARGHQVRVAVLRGDKIERDLVASIAPLVPIDAYRPLGLRNILRLDGLLQRLGVDFSWLRWLQQRWLARLLSPPAAEGIVHSHLITSDLVAAHACARVGIPWLTTIHGDYLSFERTGGSKAARVPDFPRAAYGVSRGVGAIVCITDEQLEKMRRLMPDVVRRNGFRKIYNGYPRPQRLAEKSVPEILRQIPERALVVGMVARGIRDKGWDVLLEGVRGTERRLGSFGR
jgi:glycosyltransferase involved in cell wall biosynthesis